MAENRTKATDADVLEFIEAFVDTAKKKQDSLALIEIMQETTGFAPKIWGSSIIGFGNYHYRSEKSKQAGDWPLVGFSPRKAAISLYVYTNEANQEALLKDLGKFKMGKACIYVKKNRRHPCGCLEENDRFDHGLFIDQIWGARKGAVSWII